MAPLSAVLLLLSSFAAGEGPSAPQRLDEVAAISQAAATAPDSPQAKEGAGAAFDGNRLSPDAVSDDGTRRIKKGIPLTGSTLNSLRKSEIPTPPSKPKEESSKLSTGLMLGGAAALGGLQGWFAAGALGAAAGAGLALGAAWLYHKGDYGAAFGVAAGGVIGAALGGPIGGLIGAAVGGLIGHFLGKLFL